MGGRAADGFPPRALHDVGGVVKHARPPAEGLARFDRFAPEPGNASGHGLHEGPSGALGDGVLLDQEISGLSQGETVVQQLAVALTKGSKQPRG